jgi:hypothetical protein
LRELAGINWFDAAVEMPGKLKSPDDKSPRRKEGEPIFSKPNPKR